MKRLKQLLSCIGICILLTGCVGGNRQGEGGMAVLSIRCDTAVENGMHLEERWQGIIPEDGCILPDTELEFEAGETAFDLLCRVRDDYGIQMEYSGGRKNPYVEGIQNLYEFDAGRWSGWMYSVNGEYPGSGCGQYKVCPGDEIRWSYTCDLGMDLMEEGEALEEALEWKETHE